MSDRRAGAQVSYRQLFYDREEGRITQSEFDRQFRLWEAKYPDFRPGSGCCGNVAPVGDA